jgi:hypothetical protein
VIGPTPPRQDKNDPFTGSGTYSNIGIFVKAENEDGEDLSGLGEVVVNDDGRSGTFSFKSGAKDAPASLQKTQPKKDQKKGAKEKPKKASGEGDDSPDEDDSGVVSGTWDCGRRIAVSNPANSN